MPTYIMHHVFRSGYGRRIRRAGWGLPVLLVLGLWLLPAAVWAQFPRLVVLPGQQVMDAQAWNDVLEESAFVADDFGVFAVSRWYEMQAEVDPALAASVQACSPEIQCAGDMLYGSPWAFALQIDGLQRPDGILITYRLFDVESGFVAGEASALMRASDDYGVLPQACFAALRGERQPPPGPQASARTAPRTAPGPESMAPPQDPLSRSPSSRVPSDRPPASGMLQAGRAVSVAGALLLAGGVLFGFAADDTLQEIQARPHPRGELESLQTQGRNQQRIANAGFALGGVALATGITLVVVDRTGQPDRPRATLQLETDLQRRWAGLRLRF
jgi:hypothetical protein